MTSSMLAEPTALAKHLAAALRVLDPDSPYRSASATWSERGATCTITLSVGAPVDDEDDDGHELRDRELHHFETEKILDAVHAIIARALHDIDSAPDDHTWTSTWIRDLLIDLHDVILPEAPDAE